MSLMCRSLGFDRGLQASPRNSVVHGGVTFLLRMMSLMRRNLGMNRGLQASLMSLVCLSLGRLMSCNLGMNRGLQASLMSLVCSLVGLMRGLQASPLNSVVRGGNLPNGHLPADIECGHRASLVHMRDTHIFSTSVQDLASMVVQS